MVVVQAFACGDQCQPLQIARPFGLLDAVRKLGESMVTALPFPMIHVDVDQGRQAGLRSVARKRAPKYGDTDSEDRRARGIVQHPSGRRGCRLEARGVRAQRLPFCEPRGGYSAAMLLRCTLIGRAPRGSAGCSLTSVKAWCLRWTATLIRGWIPVVINTSSRNVSVTGRLNARPNGPGHAGNKECGSSPMRRRKRRNQRSNLTRSTRNIDSL